MGEGNGQVSVQQLLAIIGEQSVQIRMLSLQVGELQQKLEQASDDDRAE